MRSLVDPHVMHVHERATCVPFSKIESLDWLAVVSIETRRFFKGRFALWYSTSDTSLFFDRRWRRFHGGLGWSLLERGLDQNWLEFERSRSLLLELERGLHRSLLELCMLRGPVFVVGRQPRLALGSV